MTLGEGHTPSEALKTAVKRLLDTDRQLKRKTRLSDSQQANYAFFSGDAPGRGVEILFSAYEAFAMRLGVELLHRWTQGTVVKILRQVRRDLEPKFSEMLSWNPQELFDWDKILENAKPGDLAVSSTRPVYFQVVSNMGRPLEAKTNDVPEVAVVDARTPHFPREPGRSITVMELTRLAHDFQTALAQTTPSKRGRGSA
ncbi:MAG: hypothetical protein A49_22220 [Methyloceanibacter sp.]|nr:MAG: hypothetical protein A49_22220 [Methyloceanibacter sp.]